LSAEDLKELRQTRRYRPTVDDVYYELNWALTKELDGLKPRLHGRLILDIGAGNLPFAEYMEGLNVETCDVSQNKFGSIDHVIAPNEALPFQRESFEALLLFDVLEHVKDDCLMARELYRILKPGGLLLVNVPFLYRFHEEPHDYRRYTPSGLRHLFEEVAGFEIEEIKPLGSLFFVAERLLGEREIDIKRRRKWLYKFLRLLLKRLGGSEEVSGTAPFSYFMVATKLQAGGQE